MRTPLEASLRCLASLVSSAAAALLAGACMLPEAQPDRYAAPAPGVAWVPSPDVRQAPPVSVSLPSMPPALEPEADRLALSQLLEVSLESNPMTRQKWQQARAAAAAWGAARGAYYPEIGGKVAGSTYDIGRSVGTTSYDGQHAVQEISLSFLLFDFGAREARAESARQVLLAANWSHDDAIAQVVRNVAQAYYGFLSAKAELASTQASAASAKESFDAAEAQRRAGEGTLVDVLTAKAQYDQARASVASAKGSVRKSRGSLASAVGWPANTEFDVSGTLEALDAQVFDDDVDSLIALARERRADLAASRASVRQMEAELQEARAARWPQLKLMGRAGGEQLNEASFDRSHFNTDASLQLEIPIFQGFTLENSIRQAQANLEASRAALQLEEESVISDVWSAYADFGSARAQLEAAESGLASAAESFAGSLERYRDGVADLVELIQAQTTLTASRSQVVEARTSLYNAYAELVYAIGSEPPGATGRPRQGTP